MGTKFYVNSKKITLLQIKTIKRIKDSIILLPVICGIFGKTFPVTGIWSGSVVPMFFAIYRSHDKNCKFYVQIMWTCSLLSCEAYSRIFSLCYNTAILTLHANERI